MRTLVERIKDRPLVLVDGVKVIHDDGWALVLPDPDEPDHPRVGGGTVSRRGPGPGSGVRPADAPAAPLTPGTLIRRRVRQGAACVWAGPTY